MNNKQTIFMSTIVFSILLLIASPVNAILFVFGVIGLWVFGWITLAMIHFGYRFYIQLGGGYEPLAAPDELYSWLKMKILTSYYKEKDDKDEF